MAIFLRRESDTFLFRRRIPSGLQARFGSKELYRSLRTTVRKLAQRRAAALYIASEHLFVMAEDPEITDEDIRAAARQWLSRKHWQERLRDVDELVPGILRLESPELPKKLLEAVAFEDISPAVARRLEAEAALEDSGYPFPHGRDVLDRTADTLLHMLREYVDKRMQAVFRPEEVSNAVAMPQATTSVLAARKSSPKVGNQENVESWLSWAAIATPERKAISPHTASQNRVTVRLFVEIIGDRPVREISREDAAHFRAQLLRMPFSHGKGGHVHALKMIASVKEGTRLLKMKTAKRHFSAANSYWAWLVEAKHVDAGPSPFSGHKFPGTKSSKSHRDDWSAEDLNRLLRSPDYRAAARESALHWLPLVSLHSGMRLEEICRLRPNHDIVTVDGVPCFKIQPHADGWDPKTEAGERRVPIHSWLIGHGFLALVEQRRAERAERIFSDLRPSGQARKLGTQFSREFSRLKTDLGISPKVVFHSFRHSFRTGVESTDLRESHIDTVMGHEGSGKSEGRTYTKRVSTAKLQEVVEAFESALPLDFIEAGISRAKQVPKVRVKKLKLTPRVPRDQ